MKVTKANFFYGGSPYPVHSADLKEFPAPPKDLRKAGEFVESIEKLMGKLSGGHVLTVDALRIDSFSVYLAGNGFTVVYDAEGAQDE